MRQKRKHKYLIAALLLGFSLALLNGCNLERFRHEKYSCNNPHLDIYDIIVRHAKKGGTVKITSSNGERKGTITSIDSNLLVIEGNTVSLQINRKTGKMTARARNKYFSMQCKLSVFTL